jgi:hypothetical protein
MQFCEKLDFLMNITNTTNSALAVNIKLDASYISRLRRGKRSMLKDKACIKAMAAYFARHCEADYQRKALADVLKISHFPIDDNQISEQMTQWLLDGKKNETKTVESFLSGFSNIKAKQKTPASFNPRKSLTAFPQTDMAIYYGVEGKRQAVIYFLSEVIVQNKPQTLLLFSDEATDWMTEDHEFTAKWALLMSQALSKGNRIKIIHTVSRDLDEMLSAINQWMPLYMSGAIEPYFYPKKRDGIFKRTLFIAPNTAAIISNSVGNKHNKVANILFRNQQAVESFVEEYNQYLSLCKPLMRVFTSTNKQSYFTSLLEFEKEKSDSIIKTESLSLLTMPETVASSIIARIGKTGNDFYEYQKNRIQLFENNIRSNSFTEIIRLNDAETVKNTKVKVAFSDMLSGGNAYYTAKEYTLHLENLVKLLKTYDNFHIKLVEETTEDRYMVYAKEDLGAIVAKTSALPVALAMNESNITAAFWDFLKNLIGEKAYCNPNNEESAQALTNYIQQLKWDCNSFV